MSFTESLQKYVSTWQEELALVRHLLDGKPPIVWTGYGRPPELIKRGVLEDREERLFVLLPAEVHMSYVVNYSGRTPNFEESDSLALLLGMGFDVRRRVYSQEKPEDKLGDPILYEVSVPPGRINLVEVPQGFNGPRRFIVADAIAKPMCEATVDIGNRSTGLFQVRMEMAYITPHN